ncbi:MAG: NYN domain-containing protein [Promethearchaeota archaeon]
MTKKKNNHNKKDKKEVSIAEIKGPIKILIDGSNIAYENHQNSTPKIKNILITYLYFDYIKKKNKNLDFIILVDATLHHRIDDSEDYDILEKFGIIRQIPAKTCADKFIIEYFERYPEQTFIISNDLFNDHFDDNNKKENLDNRKYPMMIIWDDPIIPRFPLAENVPMTKILNEFEDKISDTPDEISIKLYKLVKKYIGLPDSEGFINKEPDLAKTKSDDNDVEQNKTLTHDITDTNYNDESGNSGNISNEADLLDEDADTSMNSANNFEELQAWDQKCLENYKNQISEVLSGDITLEEESNSNSKHKKEKIPLFHSILWDAYKVFENQTNRNSLWINRVALTYYYIQSVYNKTEPGLLSSNLLRFFGDWKKDYPQKKFIEFLKIFVNYKFTIDYPTSSKYVFKIDQNSLEEYMNLNPVQRDFIIINIVQNKDRLKDILNEESIKLKFKNLLNIAFEIYSHGNAISLENIDNLIDLKRKMELSLEDFSVFAENIEENIALTNPEVTNETQEDPIKNISISSEMDKNYNDVDDFRDNLNQSTHNIQEEFASHKELLQDLSNPKENSLNTKDNVDSEVSLSIYEGLGEVEEPLTIDKENNYPTTVPNVEENELTQKSEVEIYGILGNSTSNQGSFITKYDLIRIFNENISKRLNKENLDILKSIFYFLIKLYQFNIVNIYIIDTSNETIEGNSDASPLSNTTLYFSFKISIENKTWDVFKDLVIDSNQKLVKLSSDLDNCEENRIDNNEPIANLMEDHSQKL